MKSKFVLLSMAWLLLSSCGNDSKFMAKAPLEPREEPVEVEEELSNKWTYLAVLKPLNGHLTGAINGGVTLDLEDDRFLADVRVALAPANIAHFQSVHLGTRCPEIADDTNSDGVIDAVEGNAVYGNRLLPLDGNLNGQLAELHFSPKADEWGNYIWARIASYSRMLQDLKRPDERPHDDISKLEPGEELNFEGKVAVIYGIDANTELPPTAEKLGPYTPQQTLPVACGIFKRVKKAPGTPYEDDSLGPAPVSGEVVPEILVPGSSGVAEVETSEPEEEGPTFSNSTNR